MTINDLNTDAIFVTAIAAIGAAIVAFFTLRKNTKVNKCNYLLTLDKYFAENKEIQKIYEILSDYDYCPSSCSLEDIPSSGLSTYLTFIENLNLLAKNKVIGLEDLYNLFGHRIFSALHNKKIQKLEIEKYKDNYANLFMLHEKLFLFRIKKGKTIPHIENAEYFTKDKEGCYKKEYGKYETEIEKAVELPTFDLRNCDRNDYSKIIEIQDKVITELKKSQNEKLFIPTENEKIKEYLEHENIFFICVHTSNKQICAYSYTFFDDKIEYDLSHYFANKKVATFDTVVVSPDFRGNKLHDKLLNFSIEEAKKRNYDIIAATISPDNIYSLKNFMRNGFDVLKIIEGDSPYEGYRRYVMYKKLKT